MQIEIKALTKTFTQGDRSVEVLKGVDLKILSGEVCAILGRSGSGKSTLLSLIGGLDRPSSGEIWFDQDNVQSWSDEKRTLFRGSRIGIVFQNYYLVPHLTALENVELPLEILGRPNPERAKELLSQVGLSHRMEHFPRQLSGGEAQRVAMARALIHQPNVLLADEPSGQLDSETGAQVMDLFFRLVKEKRVTAVLVTHDHELAKNADRVVRIEGGRVLQNS
jgi:putative ABC transport system ATP-binding protein